MMYPHYIANVGGKVRLAMITLKELEKKPGAIFATDGTNKLQRVFRMNKPEQWWQPKEKGKARTPNCTAYNNSDQPIPNQDIRKATGEEVKAYLTALRLAQTTGTKAEVNEAHRQASALIASLIE
jgi:hypothetical protein